MYYHCSSLDWQEAVLDLSIHPFIGLISLVNTMFWKRVDHFWCKLAQVVHRARAWNNRGSEGQ